MRLTLNSIRALSIYTSRVFSLPVGYRDCTTSHKALAGRGDTNLGGK